MNIATANIANAIAQKISRQRIIEPNTALEELYTNYSLSQLQAMLENEPDKALLQKWQATEDSLREELKLAIDFVKND